MTTYSVVKRSNRIVLDFFVLDSDTILQTVKASNWIGARAKVKETDFYQHEGYGWFCM